MSLWKKLFSSSKSDAPSQTSGTTSASPVQFKAVTPPLGGVSTGRSDQIVECALCKKQIPIADARVYHDQPSDKWFCSAECWPQRGRVIRSGIGYDCPFYSEGICRVDGGGSLCSLGAGNYWTDCHVYPTTGLKGKYDKEQGEAARRRAQLKRCGRCNVTLQISENVDFRYAIKEFASESDFKAAADSAGVSCACCYTDFCHKCMIAFGKRHPSTGGLACLACGGRMTKFNP